MAVQPIYSPGLAWRPAAVRALAGAGREAAAQGERWVLWSPVALGFGAAAYFRLPTEPSLAMIAGVGGLVLLTTAAMRAWSPLRGVSVLLALAVFAAAGPLLAKLRTEAVAGPVVPPTEAVTVEGWVVDVASPGESGPRVVIAPVRIEGLAPEQTPGRIRVTTPDGFMGPGAAVRFRALLNPPPPPAAPGAYDFARNAWFDGIGGVGVALTQPREVALPEPPLRLSIRLWINLQRWNLAHRIADRMSPGSRGLGAAMITGHEAFIDEETETNLRDAGLAHIVSISGLHMAIVGGFVFFGVRGLIALWPWMALRINGKKVAATFGLAALGLYLVVSGAPPPAQRAAITAAVAFAAILADRRAISLHALAVAAILIIAIQPEAVVEPGFQMSFAATAALVALVEAWPPRVREINTPWPIRLVQLCFVWIGLAMAVSLVAGLATGPIAMQHFGRVAVYGLPANLLTEPLSTFVFMPCLVLGAALETVGLGGPLLVIASWGLDAMNAIAGFFAGLPGATLAVRSAPAAALPTAILGILWLCLWKGRLRWLGAPAALAVALWPRPEAPLAWIAADGAAVALRDGKHAVLMRTEEKLFGAELWAQRMGLTIGEDPKADNGRYFACQGQSCRATNGPVRISAWWTVRKPKPEVLDGLCRSSDILVLRAEVELPSACRDVRVLRAADFARGGAVEIYPAAKGWRLVWAQPQRGVRPWTVHATLTP